MFVYRQVTFLLAPVAGLLLAWRRRGHGAAPHEKARRTSFLSTGERPIWLHCASAGEVVAAQPLIEALLRQDQPLLVSLWSPNGLSKLRQLFGERVPWTWLPWDSPTAMRRFVRRWQPAALWVMETEIWPNMLQAVHEADVPVIYVNGRLNDRILQAPGWLRSASRQALSQVNRLLARSQQDADRFVRLGLPSERIEVAGNLKWLSAARLIEHPPSPLRPAPYVLFASAYEDEMTGLMPLLAEQGGNSPWVIVPRRPDRDAQSMYRAAVEQGLKAVLIRDDREAAEAHADVLIETRFGNLTRWMAGAEVVLMGGSFAPHGGHNFLEAVALGRPVIVGEDMRDFEEEAALFTGRRLLMRANSLEAALRTLRQLEPARCARQGEAARALLQAVSEQVWQRYARALGLEE